MARKPKQTQSDRPNQQDVPERFEDRMVRLESLIDQIESGEIGLEESIDAYEKGVAIIESCRGLLESAEQRVEELTDRLSSSSENKADGDAGDEAAAS